MTHYFFLLIKLQEHKYQLVGAGCLKYEHIMVGGGGYVNWIILQTTQQQKEEEEEEGVYRRFLINFFFLYIFRQD